MDLEPTLMFHRCSTSVGLIRVGPDHNYMIVTHLATVLKEKFIIGFAECRRSLVRLLVSVLLSAKQSTDTNNPPPTHIIAQRALVGSIALAAGVTATWRK
jgi:hypothetical protein